MGFFYYAEKFPIKKSLNILEIGFGTGLNAFITFLENQNRQLKINYTGVEAFPVLPGEIAKLNYGENLSEGKFIDSFQKLHEVSWEQPNDLDVNFQLTKQQKLFQDIDEQEKFDLVFFDAFGPEVQPELWETAIFSKMYRALRANGILVTYSAKGKVRRAMQSVGFQVEKIPGPPGKREMLRATKYSYSQ